MNDITIHTAQPNDIEAVIDLFDAYRQFYKMPSDKASARTFIETRINNNEIIIFIAKRDNQAAAIANIYPTFSSVSMNNVWTLNDLYVDPNYRRLGIAQLLLEHINAEAKNSNISTLQLETAADNNTAQACYEQAGWQLNNCKFYYKKTGI